MSAVLSLNASSPSITNNPCTLRMNISGTLNVFRLLRDPTLCLPQHTVSTFNHLPIPLSKAFPGKLGKDGAKEVDIQAVVLDKDNCFAVPHTDEIHQPYKVANFFHCLPIDIASTLSLSILCNAPLFPVTVWTFCAGLISSQL